MMHAFCDLNDATIKANYSVRSLEPILKEVACSQILATLI